MLNPSNLGVVLHKLNRPILLILGPTLVTLGAIFVNFNNYHGSLCHSGPKQNNGNFISKQNFLFTHTPCVPTPVMQTLRWKEGWIADYSLEPHLKASLMGHMHRYDK